MTNALYANVVTFLLFSCIFCLIPPVLPKHIRLFITLLICVIIVMFRVAYRYGI